MPTELKYRTAMFLIPDVLCDTQWGGLGRPFFGTKRRDCFLICILILLQQHVAKNESFNNDPNESLNKQPLALL